MKKQEFSGDSDPRERCVFLARYKKIGVNQWIRTGQPDIDISEDPWPATYREPQVLSPRSNEAEVRVRDDDAVALELDSLLGDFTVAADRCDVALLKALPGDVIVDDLSSW